MDEQTESESLSWSTVTYLVSCHWRQSISFLPPLIHASSLLDSFFLLVAFVCHSLLPCSSHNMPNENDDIRAALQRTVLAICREQDDATTTTDPATVQALTDWLYLWSTHVLAPDLAAFAQHAGRKTTIGVQDVLLVARNNATWKQQLEAFVEGQPEDHVVAAQHGEDQSYSSDSEVSILREMKDDELSKAKKQKPKKSQLVLDALDDDSSSDDEQLFHRGR